MCIAKCRLFLYPNKACSSLGPEALWSPASTASTQRPSGP